MDMSLLQMLKHRNNYEQLIPDLPEDALHEKTMEIIHAYGKWFKETDAEHIDIEEFKVYFFNFIKPHETPDKQRYYNSLLEKCREEPDESVSKCMFEKLVELGLATQVANLVKDYSEGREFNIIDEIGLRQIAALEKTTQETDDYIQTPIGELLQSDENNTGLQFTLPGLRDCIRPLQASDFIIAAGRPDVGKTSFLASQLCGFLEQLPIERPIIWFNNEGQGNRIVKRIYQSVLGATTDDLLEKNRKGTLNSEYEFRTGGPDRIRVIDCHDWNTYRVERAIKKYSPGLVIFDMLDSVTYPTNNNLRTDEKLESLYQWARVLGVKYDFPVIATSQISAEAEQAADTLMWTPAHMLKDSKTGKQGAADLIIIIGRSPDPCMGKSRYISTPKNKLAKGDVSYVRTEVVFDAPKAQYL